MFKCKNFVCILVVCLSLISCDNASEFNTEELSKGMSRQEVLEQHGEPDFQFFHKNEGHMIYDDQILYFKNDLFVFHELRN